MSHQDNSVFVDASGRRGRKVRWAAAGVGVACLGFLAVVVAGSFGAGPAGGPLPWGNDDQHDAPALIQPDPAASEDADATPEHTAAPRATSGTASEAPAAPTAEATTEAPSPTAAATTADAPAATASAPAATTSVKPGKAGQAPGATKRPK